MLDGRARDKLASEVERAQISSLHRSLDAAWLLGYKDAQETHYILLTEIQRYARSLTSSSTAEQISTDLEKILDQALPKQ